MIGVLSECDPNLKVAGRQGRFPHLVRYRCVNLLIVTFAVVQVQITGR